MTRLPDKPLILSAGQLAIATLDADQQKDILTRLIDQSSWPLRRRLIESFLGAPIKAWY